MGGYGGLLGHAGLLAPHAVAKREADPAVVAGHTAVLNDDHIFIHNPPILHKPAVAAPLVAGHLGYAGRLGYAGHLGYAGLGHLGYGGLGYAGLGHLGGLAGYFAAE